MKNTEWKLRFNRTFMELKCEVTASTAYDGGVLIVPLWN